MVREVGEKLRWRSSEKFHLFGAEAGAASLRYSARPSLCISAIRISTTCPLTLALQSATVMSAAQAFYTNKELRRWIHNLVDRQSLVKMIRLEKAAAEDVAAVL